MPSPRRINDAQTERLLASLQDDLSYRQKLAHKIAEKENVKYASAMRRLQRYVTKAGEKRSFARAPVAVRRQVVKQARDLPVPVSVPLPTPKPKVAPKQLDLPRPTFFREIPPSPAPSRYKEPSQPEINLYDLRAVLAYFDGDAEEAGEALEQLGAGRNAAQLLELASSGVVVFGMRGSGALTDAVREWLDQIPETDFQDMQDLRDLLMDLPDWQIQMILEDMENGNTTFADWMDAWRDANMDIDETDNAYWKLWRAAYARAKK